MMNSIQSCEEESFVVLGTSPTSASLMDTFSNQKEQSQPPNFMEMSSQTDIDPSENNNVDKSLQPFIQSADKSNQDFSLIALALSEEKSPTSSSSSRFSEEKQELSDIRAMLASMNKSTSCNGLKLEADVFDTFPSLKQNGTKMEDIQKIQMLVSEYNELKETLQKTHCAMRQYFSNLNNLFAAMKAKKHEQEILSKKQKEQVQELKNELNQKDECIELNQDQIAKQEQIIQQLQDDMKKFKECSFDVVGDNLVMTDTKLKSPTNTATITSEEYETLIKQLKAELSKLLAENIQFGEMKKTYVDELDCLRVNYTAMEELYKESCAKTAVLVATNTDLNTIINDKNENIISLKNTTELAERKEKENIDLNAEINRLKQGKSLMINELQRLEKEDNLLTAEIKELKDTIKTKDDDILMLKTETDKMLNITSDEISVLKNKLTDAHNEIQLMKEITLKYEREKDELNERNNETATLHQQQFEIFKSDYEAERRARLDLTAERDEILSDLKLLQRRNEQLVKEKSKQSPQIPVEINAPTTTSTTISAQQRQPQDAQYACPLCNKKYAQLSRLESHVQICLTNASLI